MQIVMNKRILAPLIYASEFCVVTDFKGICKYY